MLTVLIIGCGNIAGGYDLNTQSEYALTHAAALNKSNQVTLAACVDNNRQAAETFAEQWAVNNSYRKLEEIPKESQFDIVCICSPSHCHETHIQQVIHFRPKVIFTEKPITTSLLSSGNILQQCESHSIHLLVNYSRYWDQKLSHFIDEFHAGGYGELQSISGFYNRGILNNGSHMLEILLRLCGPLTISASVLKSASEVHGDTDLHAMLATESGTPISLHCVDATHFSLFELQVITTTGEYCMRDGGLSWHKRVKQDNPVYTNYSKLGEVSVSDGEYLPVMEHAIDDVIKLAQSSDTRPNYDSARRAIAAQALCEELVRRAECPL
ncbi:Gfo/Idh/MocA family protein [Bacterioplanoides sp.]|uniref:Gfo/Idh/MocA family protein n=1 Tax=Bacterioplanoides sp. TaxID=2066072 RepID=UPI003BAA9708